MEAGAAGPCFRKEDRHVHIRTCIPLRSDILGGTPVFVSTRVPVRTLLDYLEAGDSLADFLEDLPSVTRELAVAVLSPSVKTL